MEQLANKIVENSEGRIELLNTNEDNQILIFSYSHNTRIIIRIEEEHYNIKCVHNGRIVGGITVKKSDFEPYKLSGITNGMIREQMNREQIVRNISSIETRPLNSNKTKNYRKTVNDIVKKMTITGRDLNIVLFGVGNARFELDIIFTFYQNHENRRKKLNLFIIGQNRRRDVQLVIKTILGRISHNIVPKFMYFMEIIKDINSFIEEFEGLKLDLFISLQMQHQDFFVEEITKKLYNNRQQIKQIYYDTLFSSLPIPLIYYRTINNELVNIFPPYLFNIMSVPMILIILNDEIYGRLIVKTIKILKNNQLMNKGMTFYPIFQAIHNNKSKINKRFLEVYLKVLKQ